MIHECSAWNVHVFLTHNENSQIWIIKIKSVRTKKRMNDENIKQNLIQCLLCDSFFSLKSIWIHFMRTHLLILAFESASYLECSDWHQDEKELISCIIKINTWNEHLQFTHCDFFWYFTAGRCSYAVMKSLSSDTQTNII